MNRVATTATAPSALSEQSITASLTAEIMTDLDNGQPMLVASTHGNQGDLQVVTVAQLLAKVAEQRTQLDRIEQVAKAYQIAQAEADFATLAAEHGIHVEEWDTRGLDERFRDTLLGHYMEGDGIRVFVVRVGQDPTERLYALRTLLANQGVTA